MPRRLVLVLVIVLGALVGLGACAPGDGAGNLAAADGNQATTASTVAGEASIVRVVDGDTIVVRIDGADEKVRLIGIDTPETKDPRRPVQCFGAEASARTAALLPPGTPVRLVRDVEARDRYGRLLAYVYRLDDDLFVNLTLALEGYAAAATYPPNVAHTDELVAAAAEARSAGRGLWGTCGGPDEPVAD